MKNLLFTLALLVSFSSFGQSRDLKKAIKKLGNVEITNKGLDLTEDFVVYVNHKDFNGVKQTSESNWEKVFFKLGLNTSDWYVKDNTDMIDVRYKVEILVK